MAAPIQQFKTHLRSAIEGFLGPSQWEFTAKQPVPTSVENGPPEYGPTAEQVLDSVGASGAEVDYPLVQAYAAGLVAQRCVEETGRLEPRALREAAGNLDFSTFYGRFRIDPTNRPANRAFPVNSPVAAGQEGSGLASVAEPGHADLSLARSSRAGVGSSVPLRRLRLGKYPYIPL